ncbi:hypothetical protein JMM63_04090 [Rhodovulum sulfidophilum]|uniref:hypothetical protein n=1 Tax=Rhodovulum sulfidophilum TaxID=35806 RepID=UPI001920ABF2|nr:hypothetical protein [Rhodovulum sulfidophilum]MBL3594757.1 hypothetical protein [Rhodovulum sulfidophilum]
MTLTPTSLDLPTGSRIILETLLTTDGKVESLLPLLELLNDPEPERSDLGPALLDALTRIAEELRRSSELREQHQAALQAMTGTIATFRHEMREELSDIRQMRAAFPDLFRRTDEMHELLFDPTDAGSDVSSEES